MRNKKLTDFSLDEVLLMEDLLYLINSCNPSINYQHIKGGDNFATKTDEMLAYLAKQGYCIATHNGSKTSSINIDNIYWKKEKGIDICKHGGLISIYERNKLEKSKLNISKWAIAISIIAFVISLFSNKPLCDFIGSFF